MSLSDVFLVRDLRDVCGEFWGALNLAPTAESASATRSVGGFHEAHGCRRLITFSYIISLLLGMIIRVSLTFFEDCKEFLPLDFEPHDP